MNSKGLERGRIWIFNATDAILGIYSKGSTQRKIILLNKGRRPKNDTQLLAKEQK